MNNDTATYDSKQKNMGFSADVDIAGGGAGSSLSVNGGKTDLSADYKGVGEQSGIFTGDGGLDLTAKGKTTLIGGAITTTDAALQAGLNNYVSKGGIETQDIENTTSYEGDAISVGVSVGNTDNKPQASMNGLGYGTDSDSDSSVTRPVSQALQAIKTSPRTTAQSMQVSLRITLMLVESMRSLGLRRRLRRSLARKRRRQLGMFRAICNLQ